MEPSSFKKTVIATLQYDKKYSDVKDTLLPIVSRSTISFKSQGVFTSKHGQRWETIEFRVPVPLINTAYEHQDVFDNLFFYVYEEDDYYDLEKVEIKPQLISGEEPPVENNVEFERIQDVLIQGVRDAHYLIWVAVAWFTNDILFQELLKKKEEGVNVRVIISQEEANQEMAPRLKESFEAYIVPKGGAYGSNRMHDKFCIIDLDYVMHGSYNWTKAANYNGETLVTSVDRKLVKDFATEFIKIINKQITPRNKEGIHFDI